jgi:hypothetical protein
LLWIAVVMIFGRRRSVKRDVTQFGLKDMARAAYQK